ncbi:MAG: enoyl-CoA hydratase/isomerase family protein [Cognaticolwellia sp.]
MSVVLFKELVTNNDKKIAIAELNSPKSLNALSLEMMTLLITQLTLWQDDDDVVMVILQGAGDKAFCAGGDVVSLYHTLTEQRKTVQPNEEFVVLDETTIRESLAYEFFTKEYYLDQFIHEYSKPIMVWGDGYVIGGGIGLFSGASHRVVTEKTLLAMPEITIGLYPDVGASWFLNKAPSNIGLFLGLTGAIFNAADAQYIGLADVIVNSVDEQAILDRLITLPWQNKTENAALLSEVLAEYSANCKTKIISNVKSNEALISDLTSYDNCADIHHAIINEEFDDKWLQSAQKKLKNGSPLSAALIYQQLKSSKGFTLAECFASELNLSLRCCQYPEFSEGVRALLVDKDKTPNWRYQNINCVPEDRVDWFFTPFTS